MPCACGNCAYDGVAQYRRLWSATREEFVDYLILLQGSGDGGAAVISNLISLIFVVVIFASFWVIFAKAGEAGWQGIIPIWNYLVMLKIVGRPWWWLILALIPGIN